ncbi:MAG: hypothetical protein P1U74_04405 [Legionellaceae bacterium]|nr:hypothetical protein [Legionellaceae bacterium]
MDNDKMLIKVQEYIKHASISLSQEIQDKEKEHAFLPSSKKTKLSQINFLTKTISAFDECSQIISNIKTQKDAEKVLNAALDKLLTTLIHTVSTESKSKGSWQEIYNSIDKLIRIFISQLAANNNTLYNSHAKEWIAICKLHHLAIPYVQLNIIGILNCITEKRPDLAKPYLNQLNAFNWSENFESVFTKKSIRDRLYQIATLLIEQAGSIDKLQDYLQNYFADKEELEILIKIYEVYLNGIQRKLNLYRISYPEFTFDNLKHPIRFDVMLAQQRYQTIHSFISAIAH